MAVLKFFNDTGKTIKIHPATFLHGVDSDRKEIKHLEICTFTTDGEEDVLTIKQWEDGKILVSNMF